MTTTTTSRLLTTFTILAVFAGRAAAGRTEYSQLAVSVNSGTAGWSAELSDSLNYDDEDALRSLAGTLIAAPASSSSGPRQLAGVDMSEVDGVDLNAEMEAQASSGSRLLQSSATVTLPDSLDLRTAYPGCLTLQMIRNQGVCGSCWSVSSMTSLTDRYCINAVKTTGLVANRFFSFQDPLDCCPTCLTNKSNICAGGYMAAAFISAKSNGVVTGDSYGGLNFCKAYAFSPYTTAVNRAPACATSCANTYTLGTYTSDVGNGKIANYVYGLGEAAMIKALNDGPIAATIRIYQDLYVYRSGVYTVQSSVYLGGHGVRVVGYGVANGVKYWLVANSWGIAWGELGYFRIRRGTNEAGIESYTFFAGTF